MSNEPHLTFDETDWRIYLNQNDTQQDITESVIEVVSQWFISTDLTIGLQNARTGKRYLISCIEAEANEFPPAMIRH